MKKLLLIITAVTLQASAAGTAVLKWDINEGDRLEIVRTASVEYLENARLKRTFQERNIVDLTCDKRDTDNHKVSGLFTVFHRESGNSVFNVREKYDSKFDLHSNGTQTVDAGCYMPNLRNIPYFPDYDLKEGDRWKGKGELIISGYSRPFKLVFDVDYTLEKLKGDSSNPSAVISYSFVIEKILTDSSYPADFPVKIIGRNDGKIDWDIADSKIKKGSDKYRIIFFNRQGKNVIASEFRMNIDTTSAHFAKVTPDDKEKEKEKLSAEIAPDKGIEVDTDDRGLVIRMGDILFDFDSHSIRPATKEKLDEISKILKKRYPDREIIVEGHSDNTGDRKYNHYLSEKRADTVAGYLKKKSGHDKFSYKGYGADRPRVDNSSARGRQQNRRVEIIIKMK